MVNIMTVINVSDLTREENLKKTHKFNIGSTVAYTNGDILIEEDDSIERRNLLNSKSFFVIAQERDCDGSLLYHLSSQCFQSMEYLCEHVIYGVIGNQILNTLNQEQQSVLINNVLNTLVIRNISEDDLKQV